MAIDLKTSVLIEEEKVRKRVQEIAAALNERFKGEEIVGICVLKGSFCFFADLIRAINADVICDFFGVSSYGKSHRSSGEVKVTLDLGNPIEGKNVVLVEDIVDTGLTMSYMKKTLEARHPQTLTTVSLLLKPDTLKTPCELDYVGFEIDNDFVVGYGMDYQGYFRELPYIARIDNLN